MMIERAPAKINLSLQIVRRREDGWHELESLVAFSHSGDVVSLDLSRASGLSVDGPYAMLIGTHDNNLVLKAERALLERCENLRSGAFHLTKKLPAAAGIGGGSSDAAATLRLLARANELDMDDVRLLEAARSVGADVPVCMEASARIMRGIGDKLGPSLHLPGICAILVNPGVLLETREVFGRLNLVAGKPYSINQHPDVVSGMSVADVFAVLRKTRNDLEDAASVIAPVITDVLAVLGAARGCKLSRMSGSGATCFGLFKSRTAASRAIASIRRTRPQWWVKGCVLR